MSLIRSLARIIAPSSEARRTAMEANQAIQYAAEVHRNEKDNQAIQTRDKQKLNSYIADRQSRFLMEQQSDSIRRIQNAEQTRITNGRDQTRAELMQAFQAGADITNQTSGNYLRQQLAMIQARHDEEDNIASVEAKKDIYKAANNANQLTSKMADVDHTTTKAETMRVQGRGEGILSDVGRGLAAYYSGGSSLAFDGMLGFQQSNMQANNLFNQARNTINNGRSNIQMDNSPDLSGIFSYAINTYFAKTQDKQRRENLKTDTINSRVDFQDDYSRNSTSDFFVNNARLRSVK